MKEVTAYLLHVNLDKIKKPNIGAKFFKFFPKNIIRIINGRSGLVSPSRKCNLKKKIIVLPCHR
jgi:hypothetical protein